MIEGAIKVEVTAVSLQQAVLCANCDVISDSPHDVCLVCGSHSLLPLARVLGNRGRAYTPAVAHNTDQQPSLPANILVLVPPPLHRRSRRRGGG